MKANLTIADRFAILGILPAEGSFATLKLVRKLREQLSLTEAEMKGYNVKQIGDQITWTKGDTTTEMEFGDFDTEMIQKALKKLNEEEKLEERHYAIYEQFVGE
jgi:hypothetical protein